MESEENSVYVGLTFDQNWNCQIERHVGCCGVDCHNPEIESIPASKTIKLRVFPPRGVCLALQLKDGQQHWSLLTGICVGVRMGAHEHTVHFFFLRREVLFFLFFFMFQCVCMCVQCLWFIWLMCGVCICLRVYTIVSLGNNSLLFGFERQTDFVLPCVQTRCG